MRTRTGNFTFSKDKSFLPATHYFPAELDDRTSVLTRPVPKSAQPCFINRFNAC